MEMWNEMGLGWYKSKRDDYESGYGSWVGT